MYTLSHYVVGARHPTIQRCILLALVVIICVLIIKRPDVIFDVDSEVNTIKSRRAYTIDDQTYGEDGTEDANDYSNCNQEIGKGNSIPVQPQQNSTLQVQGKTTLKKYPRVVILWTQWRSGSTFFGNLLASAIPNTFYSYEPLLPLGIKIFRSDDGASQDAFKYFNNLLHCNLYNHAKEISGLVSLKFYRTYNHFLIENCQEKPYMKCAEPSTYSNICRKADMHFVKVLRLGLDWARRLLQDSSLDIRIIYLVRDPRPIMQSRDSISWCENDCKNVSRVCHHLRLDLLESTKLQKDFPNRFAQIQYEHLSLKAEDTVRKVWKFLNITPSQKTWNQLKVLTNAGRPSGTFNTYRHTVDHTFEWRSNMSFGMVKTIQDSCQDVLQMLGFKSFDNTQDLKNMKIPTFTKEEDIALLA
ncbi:hypothetical protein SK128_003661 [Halocaridina rubra]|uniref:Sulfotransferase n=1 Tax=Halocaridina rubra TaxID=373956 RepID=A0AAN8X6R1_HALRR